MAQNHALVGELIERERQPIYPPKAAFGRALKVDRTTVYRILKGDPSVKAATYRRAEMLLDLPRGFLDAVRNLDATAIADSGARPDVVAWVLGQISDTPEGRNSLAQ